jgi:hypothetical protein
VEVRHRKSFLVDELGTSRVMGLAKEDGDASDGASLGQKLLPWRPRGIGLPVSRGRLL